MANLSKRSRGNLEGVHPRLRQVIETAILDTPQDFTVVEGVRTEARQRELYAQGRTSAGGIVTHRDGVTNKSNHQVKADGYGHAVDLYPYHDGRVRVAEPYVIGMLERITDHIKYTARRLGVSVTCGIDWRKPYDPPHVELNE